MKSTEKCEYAMNYHYSLQGLLYNIIRGTEYAYVHDKAGFKYFCFSNLIPITTPISNGDIRTLIISSPDSNFISVLHEKMEKLGGQIKIGLMKFKIDTLQKLNLRVPPKGPFRMITGTPILVRIPRKKYMKYGIAPPVNYEYLYWKADHPLELFLSQLWVNLQKKYNDYCRTNIVDQDLDHGNNPFSYFGELIFKKQISTKLFVKDTEQTVIGSTWEFMFDGSKYGGLNQFALEVGLGERNSMGFGFMNLKT